MEDLLTIALLDDLTDFEDIILLVLGKKREVAVLRSIQFPRINLDSFSNEECLQHFRFEKHDLHQLANLLNIPATLKLADRSLSGLEGLCIFLRRLAYPNRLTDLERIFGLSAPYISMVCKHVMHIIHEKAVFLLTNLRNVRWLTRAKLRFYSNAVGSHNVPIENCWGFIDGTARPICRPSVNQEEYFSGHKRVHCVKYQSTVCPDGMIISLKGPFPGKMHDAGILRRSNFYSELKECVTFPDGEKFVLYGDSAYPIRELLLKPFTGNNLTPQQIHFNSAMSTVRQAVEWGFGKVIREFAFLDFKKNQKINLQELEKMYFTAVLMTNCHTCLYGSQTGHYFNISPPTLREYLSQ